MRQRTLFAFAVMLTVAALLLAMPRQASAISAVVDKGKSDCNAIELGITLTYRQDDSAGSDLRDFFHLEIYDMWTGAQLASIRESITQNQSPFYWQTGRMPGVIDPRSLYRIDVWDTDEGGSHVRRVERVYFQCSTQNMWRDTPPAVTPDLLNFPAVTCTTRIPIWTTNHAPERGAVIFQYAYAPERNAQEIHMLTAPINAGDTFDLSEVEAPCGVYLRLYYQPDSNKLIYYMPSQYWPHDQYGTPRVQGQIGPIYHTFFPLNGPIRGATATPLPTATLLPTNTPTP